MAGQVVFTGHPSWRSQVMLSYLARTITAVVLGDAILYGASRFDLLATGLAALAMVAWTAGSVGFLLLLRRTVIYRVTTSNIYKKTGIIQIDKREYNLRNVQSVEVNQGRLERWITRTGDVEFTTAAQHSNIVFEGVPNPDRLADRVRAAQNDLYAPSYAQPAWQQPQADDRPPAPGLSPQQPGAGSGPGYGLPPR